MTRCYQCSEPATTQFRSGPVRYPVCEGCAYILSGKVTSLRGLEEREERASHGAWQEPRRRRTGGKGRFAQ